MGWLQVSIHSGLNHLVQWAPRLQSEMSSLMSNALSNSIPKEFGGVPGRDASPGREAEGEDPAPLPILPAYDNTAHPAVRYNNYDIKCGESVFVCHTY